jgi:hypothetical protein
VAQLVEHNLAKVGVAGSNPVVRSKSELVSGCVLVSQPCSPSPTNPRVRAFAVAVFVVMLGAGCSSSKSTPSSAPTTTVPTVPTAYVRAYTASICGSLRSLRTISRSIENFMPTLRDDSDSRTLLKSRFGALLEAASSAATLGSDFLGHASVPTGDGVPEHERRVRNAMALSARDYDRWRKAVDGFATYDRDNWENDLLTFEEDDMTGNGQPAWDRIIAAVTSGPVGAAVERAAVSTPVCAPVFAA